MMGRQFSNFVFIALVLLSSCYSSKKTQSEPSIPIVDPVRTSLDTVTFFSSGDLPIDTIGSDNFSLELQSDSTSKGDSLKKGIDEMLFDEMLVKDEIGTDTICILGSGDIMPGTNYPDNRYLPPGGCSKLFNPVRDILQSGDLTFGNLEGVFS